MHPVIGSICGVVALGLGLVACGEGDGRSDGGSKAAGSKTLTIYSSLPLQGGSRQTSEDVVAGEKLALEEAGGRAGRFAIKYVSLDDSTAAAGKWEPGQVAVVTKLYALHDGDVHGKGLADQVAATAETQGVQVLGNEAIDTRAANFRKFKQKYGHDPAPYAIYGYESMKVVLPAIEKAGENGDDRQAVVDAFFSIKDRDSVLGTYSIDSHGDTTASQEGGYRVKDGRQVFDTVLTAKDAT
jgi:ABC-type branched-subunit amino acid transport system substrate-binding protein